MKRLLLALIALSLCAGMLVYTLPLEAGKNYSISSLYGDWYFVIQEVLGDTPVQFCSGYGTVEIYNDDGINFADMTLTSRCVDSNGEIVLPDCYPATCPGPPPYTEPKTFTIDDVDAEGYFELSINGEDTHCRIVNNGRLFLCDGTSAGYESPNGPPYDATEAWSFQGIATKL
jgi:hypothetical protein